ncbi:cell envelope integrity protein CreD [Winogradskyella sp.]|uniref:cell envelope integrity protein CreD n=1 Tax=Winogradskyella sp. TaxID=1883156 RepID=UPI0026000416|nr:cell envelope integrity protein CreD [Winogradskyella sp.]MBT8245150.1 cell envelope integrity protein CreD [Winogradskyella sp.]
MEQSNTPQQEKQQSNRFTYWLKTSITARMLMVGFLVIVLLIPLSYINSLIRERSFRQTDVVNEINEKWGDEVLIYGPVLKLPYKTYSEKTTYNDKTKTYLTETETHINYAYIFPEKLDLDSKLNSKSMYLGNFESSVYTSKTNINGTFGIPSLQSKDIKVEDIQFEKATIIYKTTNLKGIKTEMAITLNGNSYNFETNFNDSRNTKNRLEELETSHLNKDLFSSKIDFNMNVTYDGSRTFQIIPVGKTTTLKMESNWSDPKFIGAYSDNDETRNINPDGFTADWKVLSINRAFSQLYLNAMPNLGQFAFGTEFVVLVDEYQKSERSAKYGFLVIGLTFLIFFLIQTMSKIHIHPFQYLMIGLALTMFYTLLVSISEHSNFLKAYLVAGISVVVLITLYSKSILKSLKFSGFIGMSLTALYTFIYVIIQLENYALLVGSIGLFLILASVMFVSRKIDWHND